MVISKISDRTGIMQFLERETGTQNVSSYTTAIKLVDINQAFDDYQNLVKRVAGSWQADDTNHTKYPNMKFDLISGQKDYNFTEDEQGNQVQDIYRVEVLCSNGKWKVLKMVNEMNYHEAISDIDTLTGEPDEYYITANGIFLVVASNYNKRLVEEGASGLRMFFTRSPNYFTAADVTAETKEPGIPNGHHKYLFWKPAYWYWMPIDTAKANTFKVLVEELERDIVHEYANRMKDETLVMESQSVNPY